MILIKCYFLTLDLDEEVTAFGISQRCFKQPLHRHPCPCLDGHFRHTVPVSYLLASFICTPPGSPHALEMLLRDGWMSMNQNARTIPGYLKFLLSAYPRANFGPLPMTIKRSALSLLPSSSSLLTIPSTIPTNLLPSFCSHFHCP